MPLTKIDPSMTDKAQRVTNEVHTALGITGLVISMKRVLKHVEVVCGIAQFFERITIGTGVSGGVWPFKDNYGPSGMWASNN